jgi:TPR repeat protein
LLGGSPAAVSNSGGQAPAPLPALSEAGNAVLRAALHAGTAYASAADFAAALRASVSGSHAQAPERARPEPAPAVPPLQAREPAAAGAGGAGGLRSAVVPVIGLVILCTVVGMAGGLGLAAYNFLLPPAKRHSTQRPFVRRALPLETPTAAPSAPPMASAVPFPSAALNSPAPGAAAVSPAPPPTGDRAARFQELLAKAQGLERDGDAAGALDGYVALAQDYPEQGNGLSRLDAFVNDLVLSPLSPAAEHRRAQQLRPAMERAAGLGSAPAMIYLAGCYEQGNGGVKQNFERAFSLLNQAYGIDPNNATTVEKLAIDYERGNGTAVDTNKAFALMKRAVDLGSVKAISELGVYYMKGLGDQPQDPRMAVSLFQEGIGKNDAECMFLYAQCLYLGEGIRVNRAEAITYYRAAAEERFPPAQAWCRDNHVSFAGD